MPIKNDYLLIFLFLLLIGVILFASFKIEVDGAKCLANPLVYGAKEMKEANYDLEFMCGCNFDTVNSAILSFNSTGMQVNDYKEAFNITLG